MKQAATLVKGIFITLLFCSLSFFSKAGNGEVVRMPPAFDADHMPGSGVLRFTENKGQWQDIVRYRSDFPGGVLFLERKGFSYVLINGNDVRQTHPPKTPMPAGGFIIHEHALKINFENALDPKAITSTDPESYYTNYFLGNDPAHWAGNVKSFREVFYSQLYAGVDLRMYSHENSLKYDLIVHPGSGTQIIKLKYDGADGLALKNGNLEIETTVGKMVEPKPYAYQMFNGTKVKVESRYTLSGNVLGFEFPNGYNSTADLIIDPNLIFSLVSGSTADNWGCTATYDDQGNFYTGGIAETVGYPTTAGAFQTTFGGGGCGGNCYNFDISITKYNPTGTARIYSTYLGGIDNEQPTSFVVNRNGELYVLGKTYSSNYPTTAGAYQTFLRGGADIVVTHFNAAGTALIGSTYMGGSADDGVNVSANWYTMTSTKYSYCDDARSDIFVDALDNAYVADCSQSVDFPMANAFQGAAGGGGQDGVVFKLNGTMSTLQWSSYLGGNSTDGAYSIILDNIGNVLVAGGTSSSNFPVTAGSFKPAFGGTIDGFVAKIANNGSSILKCTYLGTPQYDQAFFVQVDNSDNIYVLGQTQGIYPVSGGVYSNPNSSQFIQKLDSNLANGIYSTVFGNGVLIPNMSLTAFLVDVCENLYASGWSRQGLSYVGGSYPYASINGMPITANAYQTTITNSSGFHFIQLSRDAQTLLYGSYFGGQPGSEEHVDGGTSRYDKNGIIYQSVCADCGGAQNFPTTAGVVSTVNNSFNCNNGSIKMQFTFNLTRAIFSLPSYSGCSPYTVNFANNSILGVDYHWDFGNGDTSTTANPTYTFVLPGTYSVQLIAHNPNTCNQFDTTYSTVTVFPPAVTSAGPDLSICAGGQTTLTASGVGIYSWSPSATLSNPNIANPTANPSATTAYYLTLTDTNGCIGYDTVLVAVNPLPPADAGPDASICSGAVATLSASGGTTYSWYPSGGLNNTTISNPSANPANTTVYYVLVTDSNNCFSGDSVTVTVNPPPVVTISPDSGICLGSNIQITSGGGVSYSWSPAAGLSNSTISNPIATPAVNTTYTVTVTDNNGCINTASMTISVSPMTVTATPDTSICNGGQVQIGVQGSNAIAYSWIPAAGLSNPNIANPIASSSTTTTYTAAVTNLTGCVGTATVMVTVNPPPVISTTPDTAICTGGNFQITASGGSQYVWLPSAGLSNTTIANPVASPSVNTTYTVTVTDAHGCINSAITTISVNSIVVNVIQNSAICPGASTQITATGGTTYQWTPANGLSNPTVFNPSASPASTTTYTVNIVTAAGCRGSGTTTVTVHPLPVVSVSPNSGICSGNSVQLSASGGINYGWIPSTGLNNPNISNPSASPSSTTTYTVIATDINGCTNRAATTVTVSPLAIADAGPDKDICLGESAQLIATGGLYYSWLPSPDLSGLSLPNPVATPLFTSSYVVIVSNGSGCPSASDTVSVVVHPAPPVFAGTDTTIMAGNTVTLTATGGGISYQWTPPSDLSCTTCPSPIASPLHTTAYVVTTVDIYGCRNKDTVIIYVDDVLTLYVPSAFTPMSDDYKNNIFYAYGIGIYDFEFYIFDRWGSLVFTSRDPQVGWDGSFKGSPVPEDVYVYLAKATSITGKTLTKTGSVTVVR